MNTARVDVLVAGGGPAGSATASHLARRGHSVLLIDRAHFPRDKACGEYLSPGVATALGRLGVMDLVAASNPAWPKGMQILTPRTSFQLTYANGSNGRSALGLPRKVLDNILLSHARRSGVEVCEGTRALEPLMSGLRMTGLRVRDARGEREIHARFVVVADGLHSTISRALGRDIPVRWPRRLGLVASFEGVTGIEEYGQMHVGEGVYCGFAPVGQGAVNAGMVTRLGAKPNGEPVADYFDRQIAGIPTVVEALGNGRRVSSIRGVGPLARKVRRASGPGYLLVGDAAGFFDPFTGEGVHRALRGAEIAADAVEKARARDDCFPVGYERARRRIFHDKERVCLLVQLFLSNGPTFNYVAGRIAARPAVNDLLTGVLGDYEPAGPALRPGAMWNLLRP
ncbi:NAD(P)/FAD-dependent oxidoreductase [soil metagenome]